MGTTEFDCAPMEDRGMGEDFEFSELITLREAMALIPGKRVRIDSIYRATKRGLRTVKFNGTILTTAKWLKQYLQDCAGPAPRAATVADVKAKRSARRRDEVGKTLDALGV